MLLALAPTIVATPKLPAINERVASFCEAHLGERVGTGQCADLAQQALLAVGGQRWNPRATPDYPNPGDYVWGERVATVRPAAFAEFPNLLPGDILQYRDVTFEHRTRLSWSQMRAVHHTSVVAATRRGGLTVYEQNVSGRMTVGRTELTLDDLKTGTLWVYRPLASSRPASPCPVASR